RRTQHLLYDPFGAPLGQGISNTDSTLADTVTARFLGLDFDSGASLYVARGRFYDPYSGRFLSENPDGYASGETNLYRFAGNSPVDPSGPGRPPAINPMQADPAAAFGAFTDAYGFYLNPFNNDEDGYQYLWAGGKLLGWGMAIVGSAGAGAV